MSPVATDRQAPDRRAALDTVGGHVAVGAAAGWMVPFGSFQSGQPQADRAGGGMNLLGDVTYGVSRTVMLGAYGEVGMPKGRGLWVGSSLTTVAAGPLIRYHLVQGTRFDPWMSFGAGFRRTSNGGDSLTGIDWARAQLGGDWFASSALGIGPVLELALGTFLASSGPLGTRATNAHFTAGARLVFDGPGK